MVTFLLILQRHVYFIPTPKMQCKLFEVGRINGLNKKPSRRTFLKKLFSICQRAYIVGYSNRLSTCYTFFVFETKEVTQKNILPSTEFPSSSFFLICLYEYLNKTQH